MLPELAQLAAAGLVGQTISRHHLGRSCPPLAAGHGAFQDLDLKHTVLCVANLDGSAGGNREQRTALDQISQPVGMFRKFDYRG